MSWKDDFLTLYTSAENGDHVKALTLKREHLPKKLYRYRPLTKPDNIKDEICNGNVFLAPPFMMNDPFDSCSLLREHHPLTYMRTKAEFENRFEPIMDKGVFEKIFNSPNWLDNLIAYIAAKYVAPTEIDSAKETVIRIMMEELEKLNTSLNDMIWKTSRFACFTEKPTNLPMWNHYAQEHKGICVEYDTDSIDNIYCINRFFPVYYTDRLPDGTELMGSKKIPTYAFTDYFLIHKLKDWSYESEWRLIYDVGSWYRSPEDVPDDFWDKGKVIKLALPSKVFLGTKIPPSDEEQIRKWCNEIGTPVQKMKCTEYGLIAE